MELKDAKPLSPEEIVKLRTALDKISGHLNQNPEASVMDKLEFVLGELQSVTRNIEVPIEYLQPTQIKKGLDIAVIQGPFNSRIGKLKVVFGEKKHTIRFIDDNTIIATAKNYDELFCKIQEVESGAYDELFAKRNKEQFINYELKIAQCLEKNYGNLSSSHPDILRSISYGTVQAAITKNQPVDEFVKEHLLNNGFIQAPRTITASGSVKAPSKYTAVLKDRHGKELNRVGVTVKDDGHARAVLAVAGVNIRDSDSIEWI